MRFPVFVNDQSLAPPPHLCGGRNSTRCSSGFSSRSPWPAYATAAAFVPVALVTNPPQVGDPTPCHRVGATPRQFHHNTGCSSRRGGATHPPCCRGARGPQTVIEDSVHLARDLLGELLGLGQLGGQQSAPGTDLHSDRPASRRGQCGERSSHRERRCPGAESATAKEPDVSRADVQTSPDKLKTETESEAASPLKRVGNENHGDKESGTRDGGDAVTSGPVWTHSLSLPTFAPSEVRVKVRDGKVEVRAQRAYPRGPGYFFTRLEMQQTVELPDDVDHQRLTCSMKPDSTLLLRAPRKTNPALEKEVLEKEAEKTTALEKAADKTFEEKSEGAADVLELKPEQVEATRSRLEEHAAYKKDTVISDAEDAGSGRSVEEKLAEALATDVAGNPDSSVKSLTVLAGDKVCENHQEDDKDEKKTGAGPTTLLVQEEAEEKTDTDLTTPLVQEAGSEENGPETTPGMTENEVSYPVIEEPEDESFSLEDEDGKTTDSLQSSAEDFVVIGETFADDRARPDENVDGADSNSFTQDFERQADTHTPPEGKHGKQTGETEEHTGGAEDATEGGNGRDDTDPTRPIKRVNDAMTPAPTSKANDALSQALPPINTSSNTHADGAQQSTASSHVEDTREETHSEHHRAFSASLPMADFSPEDVQVKLEGHTLSITAQRQARLGQASYTESVQRRVDLPDHLDLTTVRCVLEKSGCLAITAVPKGDAESVGDKSL